MATINTLGSDLLTSTTNSGRDPWQEQLPKFTAVPAAKVVQAAEVIRGFSGSWAASYMLDSGTSNDYGCQEPRTPGPQQIKASLLGQPGFPEINFAPYNVHTNRFANKGGSLIGHPISFSVVGPTAKNQHTDWNWSVMDNSAIPASDLLTFDPLVGTPIPDQYGITPASLYAQYPGGLYLVVSLTGSEGAVYNNVGVSDIGGVGDGLLIGANKSLVPLYPTSKYEIFRVAAIGVGAIGLDDSKRLATYFTIPDLKDNPTIRAITLITPVASRLVAVPCGQAKGQETVFAIMPPARVSNHDEQYPYAIWSTGGGWTEDYPPNPTQPTGSAFEYRQKPLAPLPKAKGFYNGRVWGESEAAVLFAAGQFVIAQRNTDSDQTEPKIGDILHIHNIRVKGEAQLDVDDFQASLGSLLGWFEVVRYTAGAPDTILVRRYEEVNPLTGRSYLGSPESLMLGNWIVGDRIELDITVHDPVSTVWANEDLRGLAISWIQDAGVLGHFNAAVDAKAIIGCEVYFSSSAYTIVDITPPGTAPGSVELDAAHASGTITAIVDPFSSRKYADIDKINSARLTNIIDPRWIERSAKQPSLMPGIQPDRADRAIFSTGTSNNRITGYNANPGSLLDLGFRPVLFPAIEAYLETPLGGLSNTLVPDFDHPVDTNEVILNSTLVGEKQYVEIDYANGLVRLSHPIADGPLYNGSSLYSSDNPRGETVLFMSCVPYSMEEGQQGTGIRITGGLPTNGSVCGTEAGETPESSGYADVYGERIMLPLANQVITSGHAISQTIVITGEYLGQIPPTGTIEILWGIDGSGGPALVQGVYSRTSVFNYFGVTAGAGITTLNETHGGGLVGDLITIDNANPAVAVWRREVTFPNDLTGKVGSEYQFDTTYGSSKRTTALRVSDAEVLTNIDGTTTVKPRNTAINALFDDLFSSWLLSGGVVSDPGALDVNVYPVAYAEATVILHGVRRVVPAGVLSIPEEAINYVYIHQDADVVPTCIEVLYTSRLPLPDPEDILLAKVDTHAANLCSLDLRNPLQDINRRTDIYVGKLGDDSIPWTNFQPHFETLREAVAYANEIKTPTTGDLGPSLRIRVVGHTVENSDLGAIDILTDGLTIEGDTWFGTGSSFGEFSIPEILWTNTTNKYASATVHFNAVANGNTVVIGTLPFTGGAVENIGTQTFNISAGDAAAAISLMTVVNDAANQLAIALLNGGVSALCTATGTPDIILLTATGTGTLGYLALSTNNAVTVVLTDGAPAPVTVGYLAWGHPIDSVFNLNGHSGLSFRNLTFRTPYLRIGVPYAIPASCFIFSNVLGAPAYSDDVIIDNCKVINYASGLISGALAICRRWTITRNVCTSSVWGMGFSSVFPLYDSVITDNYIDGGSKTTACVGICSVVPAAVFQDTPALHKVLIARNKITDTDYGIVVSGDMITIEDNSISGTNQISIMASHEGIKIRNNWLSSVHSSAPALFAFCYGIYLYNGRTGVKGEGISEISGNIIQFYSKAADALGVGIYASNQVGINAEGEPIYILNNLAQQYKLAPAPKFLLADITLGVNQSTVSGNVGAIISVTGLQNAVSGNHVTTLALDGIQNTLVGNLVTDDITLTLTSNDNVVNSNWVGGDISCTTNGGAQTGLVIVGNHVVGNIIKTGGGTPTGAFLANHVVANVFGSAGAASVNDHNATG